MDLAESGINEGRWSSRQNYSLWREASIEYDPANQAKVFRCTALLLIQDSSYCWSSRWGLNVLMLRQDFLGVPLTLYELLIHAGIIQYRLFPGSMCPAWRLKPALIPRTAKGSSCTRAGGPPWRGRRLWCAHPQARAQRPASHSDSASL